MNAELLYTSAPQGLKQGSRGFCTVLSTVGMPLNLATKLESLSGYRHLYPSGTPDASKNPVGFSHLRFTVGGRPISVISRISDYGLDYSQRTNKLAHHIVVDAPMPSCGPAALLAEPGVMRNHWDGQCVNIPSPPALPDLSTEPQICRKWEAITGDAGWGGVVADAWLSTSPRPVFIIFAEHQSDELLELIKESIALLPPNKRWQATFGTYVTTLPPDVDCRVRCVVAGSDEARMAAARGSVVDLMKPSGSIHLSQLVDAARNGNNIANQQTDYALVETNELDQQILHAKTGTTSEQKTICELDTDLSLSDQSAKAPPSIYRTQKPSTKTRENPNIKSEKNTNALIFAVAFSILLLSSIVCTGYYFYSGFKNSILNQEQLSIQLNQKKNIDLGKNSEQELSAAVADKAIEAFQEKALPKEADSKSTPTANMSNGEISLSNDDVFITLSNPDLRNINPIAIPGEKTQVLIFSKNTPTNSKDEAILDQIRKDGSVSYSVIEEDGSISRAEGLSGFSPVLSSDLMGVKLFAEVELRNIKLKSEPIAIVKKAERENFDLVLSKFVFRGKEVPIGFPGSEISARFEIRNSNPSAVEYLDFIKTNAEFEWFADPKQPSSLKGNNQKVGKFSNGSQMRCIAKLPLAGFQYEASSPVVITQLSMKLEIDDKVESHNDFQFYFSGDLPKASGFQFGYGKYKFNKKLKIEQVVKEDIEHKDKGISTNKERFLQWFDKIGKAHNFYRSLGKDFDELELFAKQANGVELLKGFAAQIESLKMYSFFDLWSGRVDVELEALSVRLKEYKRLNDLYFDKLGFLEQVIRNSNQARPGASEEEKQRFRDKEVRERAYVAWLLGDGNIQRGRKIVGLFNSLISCIDDVKSLVSEIKSEQVFVVESPAFPLIISRDETTDEGKKAKEELGREPRKIAEIFLPVVVELVVLQ
jgi:hypothetical protein